MKSLYLLLLLFAGYFSFGQVNRAKLDSIVHRYDTAGAFNGVIIIADGLGHIDTYPYGYKDPQQKIETITTDDKFDLASLTKQFTGITLLQLIDNGQLNPDESIGKYFPELRPALQRVTIRQLANHTNGIHDFYSLLPEDQPLSNKRILATLARLDTTVFLPGTRWGYSNSGYVLLSMLIERVVKRPFTTYCTEQVLRPLGMQQACFLSAACSGLQGFTATMQPVQFNTFGSGEAGLYASATDIMAYYQAVMEDKGNWKKYLALAHSLADQSSEKNWMYGFGWYFTEDSTGRFRAHSGRNKGASTYIRWYEETSVFICLLSNKNNDFIKPLREEICLWVVKEYMDVQPAREKVKQTRKNKRR